MELVFLAIVAYFLFVWLPVDWVLTSELHDLRNSCSHWFRNAVVATCRTRVRRVGAYWVIEAKALWMTPWRRVHCRGNRVGAYNSEDAALAGLEQINGEIEMWVRRNDGR